VKLNGGLHLTIKQIGAAHVAEESNGNENASVQSEGSRSKWKSGIGVAKDLTTLITLVTLAVGGVATFWTIRQSRDSLQSSQQAEASQLNAYVDFRDGYQYSRVENESKSAIYSVDVAFAFSYKNNYYDALLHLAHALPPCEGIRFKLQSLLNYAPKDVRDEELAGFPLKDYSVLGAGGMVVQFFDPNGVPWWRSTSDRFTNRLAPPSLENISKKIHKGEGIRLLDPTGDSGFWGTIKPYKGKPFEVAGFTKSLNGSEPKANDFKPYKITSCAFPG
jgi:hypothetical protein